LKNEYGIKRETSFVKKVKIGEVKSGKEEIKFIFVYYSSDFTQSFYKRR